MQWSLFYRFDIHVYMHVAFTIFTNANTKGWNFEDFTSKGFYK